MHKSNYFLEMKKKEKFKLQIKSNLFNLFIIYNKSNQVIVFLFTNPIKLIYLYNWVNQSISFYTFSTDFKSTTVVLSKAGADFLHITAIIETARIAITQAITIAAIEPPDNPLELFLLK